MSDRRALVEKLLRHAIDDDMPEPDRTEHAEHVAGQVMRAQENSLRGQAVREMLGVDDMLRDIEPRR